METNHTAAQKEILNIGDMYFRLLKPGKTPTDQHKLKIKVGSYTDACCTAINLVRLVILATDSEYDGTTFGKIDICAILEVALQMIPIHEIEYLDRLFEQYVPLKNQQQNSSAVSQQQRT